MFLDAGNTTGSRPSVSVMRFPPRPRSLGRPPSMSPPGYRAFLSVTLLGGSLLGWAQAGPLAASVEVGFERLSPARTGITFTNVLSVERSSTNQILLNGSGIAAADIDGDGWCDVVVGSVGGGARVYRNLKDWRFEDVTDRMGLEPGPWPTTAVALADLNGDRRPDLLLNTLGAGTRYLTNALGRTWKEQPQGGGMATPTGAASLAIADVDGDGDLDVYVVNYRRWTLRDYPALGPKDPPLRTHPEAGSQMQFIMEDRGRVQELGEADTLFLNEGHGRFRPAPPERFRDPAGRPLSALLDWGLSAMFRDLNGDGAPDLYVCNDFGSPDRLWWNDGKGHFTSGAETALPSTSQLSMGVDVADINRDGLMDFVVVDMLDESRWERLIRGGAKDVGRPGILGGRPQYPRNTLFLGTHPGRFLEIASYSGLEATDWSWCPVFLDVDLDGYEDLLVTTGHERDSQNRDFVREKSQALRGVPKSDLNATMQELERRSPRLPLPKRAYRNRGDLTFESYGERWGFGNVGISQGLCLADLDNDGDLDALVTHLGEGVGLYRNRSTAPRIQVRLRGVDGNPDGIGALIQVRGGPVFQAQEVVAGGRYLSSDQPVRTFAAGGSGPMAVEVRWRSGAVSRVANVKPGDRVEVVETPRKDSTGSLSVWAPEPPWCPVRFEDQSAQLGIRHSQPVDDEFALQPTRPVRGSALGPGVAVVDVDRDGRLEVVVGASRGGRPALLRRSTDGKFLPWQDLLPTRLAESTQTSILPLPVTPTNGLGFSLVMGSGLEEPSGAPQRARVTQLGAAVRPGLMWNASKGGIGAMALADVDRDGTLEGFLGGRPISGRFPESSPSQIWTFASSGWRLDEPNTKTLAALGCVQNACWVDVDDDGWMDLVVVEWWGGIRLFLNAKGKLTEATFRWGLSEMSGLWNSVVPVDVDADGRLDLVVGGPGLNTDYRSTLPVRLQAFDPDQDGVLELMELGWEEGRKDWVPLRSLEYLGDAFPGMAARSGGHRAFAEGAWKMVLNESGPIVWSREVRRIDSVLLMNRGGRFEARSLPARVQFAPTWGLAVADWDADGWEDLGGVQNQSQLRSDLPPAINGEGLILMNDRRGGLAVFDGTQSGFAVPGEGRGLAVGDVDGDGRPDLVVGQNDGPAGLFLNRSEKRGLTVVLEGSPGNPDAIGAVMRLRSVDGRLGPKRLVRAGGGHWSCDSPVQILGGTAAPKSLWVRWSDGVESEYPVEPGAARLVVRK
ncbi:MAG: hypothetical protein FJ379_07935 [Verrucomicrobia bacterium]|nr:hypothetical protein [Verrucomicrobiota bacterium]